MLIVDHAFLEKNFTEPIGITFHDLEAAYKMAKREQVYPFGLKLYQSVLDEKIVVIGVDVRDGSESFLFVYFFPSEIVDSKIDLLASLEIFINRFGFKLKINQHENYIIKDNTKMLFEELTDYVNQVVDKEHIPSYCRVNFCHFYRSTKIGSLLYIQTDFSFAINIFKYQFWLQDVKNVNYRVHKKNYEWVKGFIELLKPDGSTQISTYSPKSKKKRLLKEEDLTDISVPVNYEWKLKNFIDRINYYDKDVFFSLSRAHNECLFCKDRSLSNEHIFPIWMREFFEEKIFYSPRYFSEDSSEVMGKYAYEQKKESSFGFTIKLVCVSCNTGWMAELEKKFKAILVKDQMKILKKLTCELIGGEEDRIVIARWLLLKGLLLIKKIETKFDDIIENQVFESLRRGEITEGFFFEVCDEESYNLNYGVSRGYNYYEKIKSKANSRNIQNEAYKLLVIVFQIGNFIFRISYFKPNSFLKRTAFGKKMVVIYPLQPDYLYKSSANEENIWNKINPKLRLGMLAKLILLEEK